MPPLGVPEPLRIALVDVMLVAGLVVAVGAVAVVKDRSAPNAVPSLLCTMAQ